MLRKEGIDVSTAHFSFINPLPPQTEEVFSRFSRIMVCELNSGQFAAWLRSCLPGHEYIQYNKVQGQTFLSAELADAIRKAL